MAFPSRAVRANTVSNWAVLLQQLVERGHVAAYGERRSRRSAATPRLSSLAERAPGTASCKTLANPVRGWLGSTYLYVPAVLNKLSVTQHCHKHA